jgi:signal transduction histidine kinase
MPAGGTLRISGEPDVIPACGEQPAEPAVRLVFSDTGVGLSPGAQERLFEPFFTTKDGGAGLGLYVTYGIVGAHHGQIQVESQEGAGTTFTLLLPRVQPA